MDLPKNEFRAALKAGRRQIGLWCSIPESGVVEMLAGTGYDWILIDAEHAPVTVEATLPLLQAAAPYPVSTLVRPAWNDPVTLKKLLDIGAQTVLIPYVQSAAEAERAVAAVHYPPRGLRGVAGITRASRFGEVKDYTARAGEEICLLLQVETADALDRIEEIAAVPGVDGIFIGPADLAASMGYPGQPSHPEVMAAVLDGIRRIIAAGLPAGYLSLDPEALAAVAEAGAQFIAVDVDSSILRRGALATREAWR